MAKRTTSLRVLRGILCGTGAAVIGVYAGFCVYYHGHYFPHTTIGGISCGNQTADDLEAKNIASAQNYQLHITDRKGNKYTLSGSDFSYTYKRSGEEQSLVKQQKILLWPVALFQKHQIDLNRSFHYDETALNQLTDALAIFDPSYIEAPENAHLRITDDDYTIVNETPGNTPIRDEIIKEIQKAIDDQETTLTLSDACYEKPSVTADDQQIADTVSQLDRYMAATVTYEIKGADEGLDKAGILSLLDLKKDGSVSINDTRLTSYVQHLASTYNTYGDVRKFKTSKGDTVKIGGGDYGWVIDQDAEVKALIEAINSGVTQVREPVYLYSGYSRGTNDIGSTYVEIDLTNQRLVFYMKGTPIVDTPIVSGNPNIDGCATPEGCYALDAKESPAVLTGEDYETNVTYWMPFAGNVGIHDATWRTEFGGNMYQWDGSHGCINVPYDKAAAIYANIEVGMPVVVYE